MRKKVSIIFALLLVLGFGTVAFAGTGASSSLGSGHPSMRSSRGGDRHRRRRHHRRRRARRHMHGHSASPKNANSH